MIKTPTSWVGVNTSHPNSLVKELWESKTIPHWQEYDAGQLEVKINKETRLDMALWKISDQRELKKGKLASTEAPLHFIEVKNISLAENSVALFPDAVTERGQKHLKEMMELMDQGHTCELVFVVQRQDCEHFAPADLIDPEYGKILRKAHKKGLRVTPLTCEMSPETLALKTHILPLKF